jgi:glucose-6-phosphate dehydrogenase assembly protein OpcA
LPLCRLDIEHHCTTVQVLLVKMQRIMKPDKYVAVSSVDIGECVDLSLFKMPRNAETSNRPKEVQRQATKVLHSVRNQISFPLDNPLRAFGLHRVARDRSGKWY